ncbi:MAG: GspE/PulE family protein [Candidatus Paceibacterota bacterium]
MVQFEEDKQNRKVALLLKEEEEKLAEVLSHKYGVKYIDLTRVAINTEALRLVPETDAREANLAPFGIVGKKVQVAIQSPNNEKTKIILEDLKKRNYILTIFMVSKSSLNRAWSRYTDLSFASQAKIGALDISNEDIIAFLEKVKSIKDIQVYIAEALTLKKTHRVSRLLSIIMGGALSTSASDVHIEPEEGYTRLRYRLDGVLINVVNFDKETYEFLLSRIKLVAGLKLNIKNNAQDGRFSINIKDVDIEVRTSTLPGAYGESIVMRLLNPKSISVPLEELGFEPKLFKILENEIAKPNGMILNTGPTGSGKTTTLYAFLKRVHTPEVKIITIEDPIEYHLPGIVQTQVDKKKEYTFSSGLRASLRQDPDIIMVGEIRDNETAEIALHSALTGHLVFSTLHTNNAAGTYPRLIDLGINSRILSSAINVAMAQRLVRILCPKCKKPGVITDAYKKLIDNALKAMPKDIEIPPIQVWEPVGCDFCNNTGYKGRIGVFEAILTDEATEEVIKDNPSEREVKKASLAQGIPDMQQDGVIKALRGTTSLAELERVVDLSIYRDLNQVGTVGLGGEQSSKNQIETTPTTEENIQP